MADTAQVLPLVRPEEGTRRVTVLAAFRVADARGHDLTPKGRKTRALLAYLLLARGPVSRERLAGLLWGDRGEEQAKASLRQALYELKDLAGGPGALITASRDEAVAHASAFQLDIDRLAEVARVGDLGRLAGELDGRDLTLLADLDGASPDFDGWLAAERTRRRDRLLAEALEAGRAALVEGRAADVQRLADALERIDSLNEPAVRLGMAADRQAGDLAALHRRFRRFAGTLRDELGAAPADETRALLEPPPPTAPAGETRGAHATAASPTARAITQRWGFVAALAVLLVALAVVVWPRLAPPPPTAPSLAVLPFHTAGPGYFGPGFSEAILDIVARDPKLKVVGSASSRAAAAGRDPLAAARRIGVAYVLSGEAEEREGRVAIAARLVRAADGRTVWNARFNRPVEDVFAVQNEVAGAVAQQLGLRVAPAADPHRVTRPDVYDRYLQALGLVRERRVSTLLEARRLLLEAVSLDPNYAPAFASLSEVTMLLADHPTAYGATPMAEAQATARTYARRALELSPTLGEAYAAYGLISLSDAESLPFYERAVALDPQRADFHRWLGTSYQIVGRQAEALRELERAAALEPLWALCAEHLVGQLIFMGRIDEARAVAARFARVSGDGPAADKVRSELVEAEGRLADFLAIAEAAARRDPERSNLAAAAKAWALLGENERAARMLGARDEVGRLALTGDVPGLARLAVARGRGFWDQEPEYWGLAQILVRGGQGPLLLRLYDQEFRSPAELHERNPGLALSIGPTLITALTQAGRGAEAQDLARRILARLDTDQRNGVWAPSLAPDRAAVLAAAGRGEEALAQLDLTLRTRWQGLLTLPYAPLAERAPFRRLRGDPRLAAIDRSLLDRVNGQRSLAGLPPRKN